MLCGKFISSLSALFLSFSFPCATFMEQDGASASESVLCAFVSCSGRRGLFCPVLCDIVGAGHCIFRCMTQA